MKEFLAILAALLVDVLIKVIEKLRSGEQHFEGYTTGTTENRLREKARKDGWNV